MRWPHLLVAIATACLPLGCAPRPAALAGAGHPPTGALAAPAATTSEGLDRLARLSERRRAQQREGEYALGEGDVISVRAFDFNEMNQRVRVEGDGTITLPLLNTVPVAGRTVSEVQRELTRRLGAFMYDPQLTVFVEEYRSQQVSVEGAVQRPGLISQAVRNATVRDVLSGAGGLTAEAGNRIVLVPAETRASAEADALALNLPRSAASDVEQIADAIVVDTAEADQQVQRTLFSLPVRGGDVIIVPAGGKFVADGWVAKPGTYPITAGLTLRGALATAGGLTFPARTGCIRIYRKADATGESTIREVDYKAVAAQKAPDVFIHDGDVVQVASSPAKLVPYVFYKGFTSLVQLGAGIRVAP